MNTKEWFRNLITGAGIIVVTVLLVACGGGGGGGGGEDNSGGDGGDGGDGGPPVTGGGISGAWTITETGKQHNCGVELPLDSFTLNISQNGNLLNITDDEGNTVEAVIYAERFIWQATYADAAPDGTPGAITINPLTASIDGTCDNLAGTANWTWDSFDGSVRCSGTTSFTGSKSPATGCGDFNFGNGDSTPPSIPGSFTLANQSGSIVLTWQDATDDVAVAGYKIYRGNSSPAGEYYASLDIGDISRDEADYLVYSDTGLEPMTNYCYAISAFDAAGNESEVTDTQCIQAPDIPPAAPGNFNAHIQTYGILDAYFRVIVTWQDQSDDETGFEVGYCRATITNPFLPSVGDCAANPDNVLSLPSDSSSHTFSGFSNYFGIKRFRVYVRACKGALCSPAVGGIASP